MTAAAIYARVSTARQAERDLSLPDQVAQCQAYCERNGWEVVEVFCEPGASALRLSDSPARSWRPSFTSTPMSGRPLP